MEELYESVLNSAQMTIDEFVNLQPNRNALLPLKSDLKKALLSFLESDITCEEVLSFVEKQVVLEIINRGVRQQVLSRCEQFHKGQTLYFDTEGNLLHVRRYAEALNPYMFCSNFNQDGMQYWIFEDNHLSDHFYDTRNAIRVRSWAGLPDQIDEFFSDEIPSGKSHLGVHTTKQYLFLRTEIAGYYEGRDTRNAFFVFDYKSREKLFWFGHAKAYFDGLVENPKTGEIYIYGTDYVQNLDGETESYFVLWKFDKEKPNSIEIGRCPKVHGGRCSDVHFTARGKCIVVWEGDSGEKTINVASFYIENLNKGASLKDLINRRLKVFKVPSGMEPLQVMVEPLGEELIVCLEWESINYRDGTSSEKREIIEYYMQRLALKDEDGRFNQNGRGIPTKVRREFEFKWITIPGWFEWELSYERPQGRFDGSYLCSSTNE